jgi:hypothetical protein
VYVVRSGVVALVVLVALAGCSGLPVSDAGSEPSATVTPAPVPESTPVDRGPVVGEQVDGGQLEAAHADALVGVYTRIVDIRIVVSGERRLDYRGALTNSTNGDRSLRTRTFSGAETPRFAPGLENVSMARERRYAVENDSARLRVIDGDRSVVDGSDPPPLESPVPMADAVAPVGAILDGATVTERTVTDGYRLSGDTVGDSAVPAYLDDVRNVTVGATIRSNGQITLLSVQYEATFDGERATVTQNIYWSPPAEPLAEPPWYGDSSTPTPETDA